MYTKQAKKMLPFNVLDILQKYTDENHRLNQRDIEKCLADKYDMVVDRRSVRRSISDLMEMGVDIQYTEITRMVKDNTTGLEEEQAVLTGFYLERDFSDCEIRLLIDELMDSHYIPTKQRKQLIEKLEGLSNVYFRKSKTRYWDSEEVNNQLFYTIETIDKAIDTSCMVRFFYGHYSIKGIKYISNSQEYIVTPYDMKVVDGNYLLICDDGKEELRLRLDLISEISIVQETGKKRVRRIQNYIEKNIRFATTENILQKIIDKFGNRDIRIEDNDDKVVVSMHLDEEAAVDFAVKHSDVVTVLSPDSCRKKVMEKLQEGLNRYLKAS